jgi:DNA-binding NarL/FixJ family response regulator
MSIPAVLEPSPHIRVLIVDDQTLIRRGMSLILGHEPDIDVVGQAADGEEAIAIVAQQEPDVVLMDLHMPGMGGVQATREITSTHPNAHVMVLTTFDADEMVFEAIRAGAKAYLLKDASEADVLETIRAVHRGESRLAPNIARKVIEQFRRLADQAQATRVGEDATRGTAPSKLPALLHGASSHAPLASASLADALTDKEERVLELIAEGKSNKDIAHAMFLAEGTVKNYVSRIMEKLHARTRTELAVRALREKGI